VECQKHRIGEIYVTHKPIAVHLNVIFQ
jgi:hypothetical protein